MARVRNMPSSLPYTADSHQPTSNNNNQPAPDNNQPASENNQPASENNQPASENNSILRARLLGQASFTAPSMSSTVEHTIAVPPSPSSHVECPHPSLLNLLTKPPPPFHLTESDLEELTECRENVRIQPEDMIESEEEGELPRPHPPLLSPISSPPRQPSICPKPSTSSAVSKFKPPSEDHSDRFFELQETRRACFQNPRTCSHFYKKGKFIGTTCVNLCRGDATTCSKHKDDNMLIPKLSRSRTVKKPQPKRWDRIAKGQKYFFVRKISKTCVIVRSSENTHLKIELPRNLRREKLTSRCYLIRVGRKSTVWQQ